MSLETEDNIEIIENEEIETQVLDDESTEYNPNEITYIKSEDVKEFIKRGSKIVLLYMPHSSPSQFQEEQLNNAYESFGNKVSVGMLDVLDSQEYAISMKVRSFPTTMYFKEGSLILSETGVQRDIENAIMQII